MTRDEIKNLPASVRQRLMNLADRSGEQTKQKQWASFLAKSGLPQVTFSEAAVTIEMLLAPPTLAAAKGRVFRGKWPPAGPWRDTK